MDSVINTVLQTIILITNLVQEIRDIPHFIQKVIKTCNQLGHMLRPLHSCSIYQTLSDENLTSWLSFQEDCHSTLRRIEEILRNHVRRSKTNLALFYLMEFYFGPKQELSGLTADLETYIQRFIAFSHL
jgi:hypothetical protein